MTGSPKSRASRIVGTLGPASSTPERIEELIAAGLDVARLNFSHGTREDHLRLARAVREAAARVGRTVGVLVDLQGHKVRVGRSSDGRPISLRHGERVSVEPGDGLGPGRIGIDYPRPGRHARAGRHLYLDDGLIDLVIRAVDGDRLECEVEVGGELADRKGVTFAQADLDFPLLAEKDLEDAAFIARSGLDPDFVAMSFVRSAAEIDALQAHLAARGAPGVPIVAKIEDRRGIASLDEILEAADGVMIARGDLGVSLPRERVPGLQRRILRRAAARGVPAITATQMLESMTLYARPTRAEVSDVHTAVIDGTDAVMLSAETATGAHPVASVREMDRICRAAEGEGPPRGGELERGGKLGALGEIAVAAAELARRVSARRVVGLSRAGRTLRALGAARGPVPVIGIVAEERILRRLTLSRGVEALVVAGGDTRDESAARVLDQLESRGLLAPGDRVVLVAAGELDAEGRPVHRLELRTVGDPGGRSAGADRTSGRITPETDGPE